MDQPETAPGISPSVAVNSKGEETPTSEISRWVDRHGESLFRYALARVRDTGAAELLLQETFVDAALHQREHAGGPFSERSWLLGILKGKVIDRLRRTAPDHCFTDLASLQDEQSHRFIPDGIYQGGWIHELGPVDWAAKAEEDPDRSRFWETFHACADKLPENLGRIFCLRDIDDLSGEEVCQVLGINPTNLRVMLHRARLALRQCLETHWLGPQTT